MKKDESLNLTCSMIFIFHGFSNENSYKIKFDNSVKIIINSIHIHFDDSRIYLYYFFFIIKILV